MQEKNDKFMDMGMELWKLWEMVGLISPISPSEFV